MTFFKRKRLHNACNITEKIFLLAIRHSIHAVEELLCLSAASLEGVEGG